jgi:hypothetical protein
LSKLFSLIMIGSGGFKTIRCRHPRVPHEKLSYLSFGKGGAYRRNSREHPGTCGGHGIAVNLHLAYQVGLQFQDNFNPYGCFSWVFSVVIFVGQGSILEKHPGKTK